jgi:hypothetical protein
MAHWKAATTRQNWHDSDELAAPKAFKPGGRCYHFGVRNSISVQASHSSQRQLLAGNGNSSNSSLVFLTDELRQLSNMAMLAFEVIKSGNVGVRGSTGPMLDRSLESV